MEKLDNLLDEMRGRLTQWRRYPFLSPFLFPLLTFFPFRAIRLDNHIAEDRYITGANLAAVFAKNGLRLSLSDLKILVANYSAPRDLVDRDPSLMEVFLPPYRLVLTPPLAPEPCPPI